MVGWINPAKTGRQGGIEGAQCRFADPAITMSGMIGMATTIW